MVSPPRWTEKAADFTRTSARTGLATRKTTSSLVYQSRLTWVASRLLCAILLRPQTYKANALHGLDFLDTKLWDAQHGGFWWALDEKGKPERDGEKHVYGIAFGIYAASACYQATREPRALELAKPRLFVADAHAHDNAGAATMRH